MARIRNVKPAFFRHEALQDLEARFPEAKPMLVFEGLWGHCDKGGRFEWRPRLLKLDILPFLHFEMEDTLQLLRQHGFVRRYVVAGKVYGVIDTFTQHQRIGGKEASEDYRLPDPEKDESVKDQDSQELDEGKHRGSNGEAPVKQQGSTGEAVGKAGSGSGSGSGSGRGKREREFAPERCSGALDLTGLSLQNPTALRTVEIPPSTATWLAYAEAYRGRYGVEPVRNRTVNGQLAHLVQRLGTETAPAVAAFYVAHNFALYVRAKHPVSLLLRDAEGLHTEFRRGTTVTASEAAQTDRTSGQAAMWNELIEEARAKGTFQHPSSMPPEPGAQPLAIAAKAATTDDEPY